MFVCCRAYCIPVTVLSVDSLRYVNVSRGSVCLIRQIQIIASSNSISNIALKEPLVNPELSLHSILDLSLEATMGILSGLILANLGRF